MSNRTILAALTLFVLCGCSPKERDRLVITDGATITLELEDEYDIVFSPWHTDQNKGWALQHPDGRFQCGRCVKEGLKSAVSLGGCLTTLVYCPQYYDEDGNYHWDACNASTCSYTCSQGHWFSTTTDAY